MEQNNLFIGADNSHLAVVPASKYEWFSQFGEEDEEDFEGQYIIVKPVGEFWFGLSVWDHPNPNPLLASSISDCVRKYTGFISDGMGDADFVWVDLFERKDDE